MKPGTHDKNFKSYSSFRPFVCITEWNVELSFISAALLSKSTFTTEMIDFNINPLTIRTVSWMFGNQGKLNGFISVSVFVLINI